MQIQNSHYILHVYIYIYIYIYHHSLREYNPTLHSNAKIHR